MELMTKIFITKITVNRIIQSILIISFDSRKYVLN